MSAKLSSHTLLQPKPHPEPMGSPLRTDGFGVGTSVGVCEGRGVGAAEGNGVGPTVGTSVGCGLGGSVGVDVGT